jgi:hypothetical protein
VKQSTKINDAWRKNCGIKSTSKYGSKTPVQMHEKCLGSGQRLWVQFGLFDPAIKTSREAIESRARVIFICGIGLQDFSPFSVMNIAIRKPNVFRNEHLAFDALLGL